MVPTNKITGTTITKEVEYILQFLHSNILPLFENMNLGQVIKSSGLPWWFGGKESACNAGDVGSILGLGRCPGEGNDNSFQFSCLGNPMDRGAWQAIVHGVTRVKHDLVTKPSPPI